MRYFVSVDCSHLRLLGQTFQGHLRFYLHIGRTSVECHPNRLWWIADLYFSQVEVVIPNRLNINSTVWPRS